MIIIYSSTSDSICFRSACVCVFYLFVFARHLKMNKRKKDCSLDRAFFSFTRISNKEKLE